MAISKSLVKLHELIGLRNSNPPLEREDSGSTLLNSTTSRRRRRRRSVLLSISGTLTAQVFFADELSSSSSSVANAVDFFNLVSEPEPERSIESAQEGIRKNAGDILGTKEMMVEKKQWREAQRELRRSASNMKQDMYTIIRAKPPMERPLLRSLYSNLFTTITKLDYAARDEDATNVLEYYKNIAKVLEDIFSKI